MANLYDPNVAPEIQDINRKQKMAEILRQQSLQSPQGQMVSGRYVAPNITQNLSRLLQSYQAGKMENDAVQQGKDYQSEKAKAFAAILAGNKPNQTQNPTAMPMEQNLAPTQPMGGMQPSQPNQQEHALPVIQPQGQDQQAQLLAYMGKYGADPSAQYLLNRNDKLEDRNYAEGYNEKIHARDRGEHVSDVKDQQEFQRVMAKEQQGFQLTQQEKQFAQQYKLQAQSQNFQAGQNTLSRNATLNAAAPIAVLGPDGKPKYVNRADAIGQQPYSAKQEAADALKVQQKSQAEIGAQQVLDQALMLHQHPGRGAGTGASSFLSSVPGTDAKGFKANLDTFKAQTFVPMVSALKGMGALSDAEGKKLSDSVGALDPSMPEAEFDASLQRITKTLYDKAKATGLNVSMPDFGTAPVQPSGRGGQNKSKTQLDADKILGL